VASTSSSPPRVDREPVLRAVGVRDPHDRREARDRHLTGSAGRGDRIVGGGSRDAHLVHLAIARGIGRKSPEVHVDGGRVRGVEIVQAHRVGAPERPQLELLDAVEILREDPRGEAPDVAMHAHAAGDGRHVDVIVGVRAADEHAVRAGLAFDPIVAQTRVRRVAVVAEAEVGDVIAALALDAIVAVAADQDVRAEAADHVVVTVARVDRQRGHVDHQRACRHAI
jgi:hypothetical protein